MTTIINVGEAIKRASMTKDNKVTVHEGDNRLNAQTSNIAGQTCRILFMNASIAEGIGFSTATVGEHLQNALYAHIRLTTDGQAFAVLVPRADIVEFCKAFGLRAISKKFGAYTQLQLNLGKLTKTTGAAWEKWAKWGKVVDVSDRYGKALEIIDVVEKTALVDKDGKVIRNQKSAGNRIKGLPYKTRGQW